MHTLDKFRGFKFLFPITYFWETVATADPLLLVDPLAWFQDYGKTP